MPNLNDKIVLGIVSCSTLIYFQNSVTALKQILGYNSKLSSIFVILFFNEGHERGFFRNKISNIMKHLGHNTVFWRSDYVFHLHRDHNHQWIASLHLVAVFYMNFFNDSGHWCNCVTETCASKFLSQKFWNMTLKS